MPALDLITRSFRENISLKELAALVLDILREGGIDAILVGGACVSLYTDSEYQSYDLDFVTHASLKDITELMRRPPVLWDNYPVNDSAKMSRHLHLAPFEGRPCEPVP